MPAHETRWSGLFYNLKVLGPLAWLLVRGRGVGVRRLDRRGCCVKRGHWVRWHCEREAVTRLLGEDAGDGLDRHGDFLRRAAEARGELHPFVVDRQPPRRPT